MKLLIFIGIALTCASPIISNNGDKQIPALEEEKERLREEYASFNGTELENLGKDTYFYGLSDLQGPLILMQFLEYGNFNYQQFASSVHRNQKIRRMIEDLKFAKDKRHLFESYGKVYQEIASRGVELF